MRRRFCAAFFLVGSSLAVGACEKPTRYTTTVQVLDVHRHGQDPKAAPGMTDLELKFIDCPGDARKIVRSDKAFGPCGAKFQKGDKIPAEVVLTYSSERSQYRNEIVRLGDCPLKLDPKEDANYEMIQDCRDLVASGAVVGVHCDRTRNKELVAKCPWFRRR
jgi:hypothetical protein